MMTRLVHTPRGSCPFVVPITVWVSWSDMASMKIPNKAVLALMAIFRRDRLIALPLHRIPLALDPFRRVDPDRAVSSAARLG